MKKEKIKQEKRERRRRRVRAKIFGTANRPRLSVFRSNAGMYAQLIDDERGHTLVSAHSREIKKGKDDDKKKVSFALGKLLAEKALKIKIKEVVFDRGGYKYHGRVKALADGAREGGLKF